MKTKNSCKEKLLLILSQPEGQFTEFKESTSKSISRELVGFSNSGGGCIVIGVNDKGEIVGISDINEEKSKIETIARNCDPSISVKISSHKEEGKIILLIEVPEGKDKPYSCSSGFFLRSGANTQKMKRDEIIDFIYSTGQINYEEKICKKFDYPEDFDEDAFEDFIHMADISKGRLSNEDILTNLGVAEQNGKNLVFNNAGVLFFAKEPTKFLRHAVVDCILFKGKEKLDILDRKEFKDPLFINVQKVLVFLQQHLSLRYEIEGLRRKEILEIPEEALREVVLNAVMHRDYHFDNAWVTVEIYKDRLEISDPGGLPPGITLQDLGKKSVPRNKLIADLFHRIGEVERAGTGINRIKKLTSDAGLPEPTFETDSFFTVKFERAPSQKNVLDTEYMDNEFRVKFTENFRVNFNVKGKKLDRTTDILFKLAMNKSFNVKNFASEKDVSVRTVREDIRDLKDIGLIEFKGPPKTGKYILTEKGKELFDSI